MYVQQNKLIPDNTILLLVTIGICAFLFMLWLTDYAIGVSPDSTMYLEAAENFLMGNGFYANGKPVTNAPPGYSFAIAIVSYFYQGDVLLGARLLHAITFGINAILLGVTCQLIIPNHWSTMGFVLLGFLSSPIMVFSHAMAWSDLLFLTACLLTFIILAWHIQVSTWYSLFTLSLVISLATLVRYVGITLLPPIIVIIFIYQRTSVKDKIKEIFLLNIIAIIPLLIWITRNLAIDQSVGGREHALQFLGFHLEIPVMLAQLFAFVIPINWSVQVEAVLFIVGMAIIISVAVVLYQYRYFQQNFYSMPIKLFIAYALFFITYLLFLIFSQLFLEVRNSWDARILIPAFVSLVMVVFHLVWSLEKVTQRKFIRLTFFFVIMISISLNMIVTIPETSRIHATGYYYTSQSWQESKLVDIISGWESGLTIYSNVPDLIRFLTNQEAIILPHHTPVGTRDPNPNYAQELEMVCQAVHNGEALLIYIENVVYRWYLPTVEEIVSTCNLPVLHELKDGFIFGQAAD